MLTAPWSVLPWTDCWPKLVAELISLSVNGSYLSSSLVHSAFLVSASRGEGGLPDVRLRPWQHNKTQTGEFTEWVLLRVVYRPHKYSRLLVLPSFLNALKADVINWVTSVVIIDVQHPLLLSDFAQDKYTVNRHQLWHWWRWHLSFSSATGMDRAGIKLATLALKFLACLSLHLGKLAKSNKPNDLLYELLLKFTYPRMHIKPLLEG